MTRHVLIGPSGGEVPLDGSSGVTLLKGVDGRLFPPFETVDEPAIGRSGGTRLRHQRVGARDVELPLNIEADGAPAIRELIRDLASRLNPHLGSATLKVEYDDGTSRFLQGRLTGTEAPEDAEARTPGRQLVTFTLRAFDPFWRSQAQQIVFALATPSWFPAPPLGITSGVITGTVSIHNDGDVDAWPVWRLRGPGGPFVAAYTDADGATHTLELDVALTSGEEVVIDTREGVKTVRDGQGTNLYPKLADGSELWPLPPGVTTVDVEFPGGESDSRATLEFQRRHLTP